MDLLPLLLFLPGWNGGVTDVHCVRSPASGELRAGGWVLFLRACLLLCALCVDGMGTCRCHWSGDLTGLPLFLVVTRDGFW